MNYPPEYSDELWPAWQLPDSRLAFEPLTAEDGRYLIDVAAVMFSTLGPDWEINAETPPATLMQLLSREFPGHQFHFCDDPNSRFRIAIEHEVFPRVIAWLVHYYGGFE